ncbi:hypothetical protein GCM10009007_13990 [Formosimonas limnophila]|uniref:Uncharacterized protein n=1 Tax=Formosimonas limnophila TaxID=1384487 RepID=A0A8J3FYL0_9BURK|nr:PhaM family polyhydroxyalkanoate granule multifunctional regulatory protein [Formosimonas limnophila]GHA74034.1 hypothetical protein GCM10009007_13990 [Formosimonas limnophila]
MFLQMPSFFPWANGSSQTDKPEAMFAGVPLVNPLLHDAQQNMETLDERIAQFESVAQWLSMNLQMVNHAVQQLQVQKQTLFALAQWQTMSKDALSEWSKVNPFANNADSAEASSNQEVPQKKPKAGAKPRTKSKDVAATQMPAQAESVHKIPAAFEHMTQSWWDGLQTQFAQLAQPIVSGAADKTTPINRVQKPPTTAKKASSTRQTRTKPL